MTVARAAGVLLLFAAALVPADVHAQQEVARADALLRSGRVEQAERWYYAAARRRPRDPDARFALGGYLASRGALRVGAVLIEEARQFGGDPVRAASMLAPIYAQLGDFAAVARLPQARLSAGELARARWLQSNAPTVSGPDTTRLPLLPPGTPTSLGAVRLLIAGDTVRAEIDPLASGIVLDRTHVRTPGVRAFDAGGVDEQPAVIARATVGPYVLRNVPVTLADAGGPGHARVGLDWLIQWAPTIDPGAGRSITLRRGGRVPAGAVRPATERVPLVFSLPGPRGEAVPGPWIAVPGGMARLDRPEIARLRSARITVDPRRGELLVDR